MDKKHITIPTTYATTYRYTAIAGNTHLLVPETTPNIQTLCTFRGISYQQLGLAKTIILIYKYLRSTLETKAVKNSKYVIVPRTISHSPKAAGKKWADEIILEIFTAQPIEIEILNGNMGITIAIYQDRLPITPCQNIIALDEATKVSIHIDSESILKNYIPDSTILQIAPHRYKKTSP